MVRQMSVFGWQRNGAITRTCCIAIKLYSCCIAIKLYLYLVGYICDISVTNVPKLVRYWHVSSTANFIGYRNLVEMWRVELGAWRVVE